jgi:DNA ligase-associated metallophosphoesterase
MAVSLSFAGETFRPLPCGGLYWPAQNALLVADLHFEKASFYGTHGQFLPPYDSVDTLACLIEAIAATGATRIWCLGDSFHDAAGPARLAGPARDTLQALTRTLDWVWITGNHDDRSAATLGGRVMAEAEAGPLLLRHEAEPGEQRPEVSGHYHPKLRIRLRGRTVARRCFAMTATKLVLPSYGALTGGLDIGNPAFVAAMGGPVSAYVALDDRVLCFPATRAEVRVG